MVAGATGRVGRVLVQQLQEIGYANIRGITRNKDKAMAEQKGDIDWFQADVRDPETLKTAFAGVGKVISTVGADQIPGLKPEFVDYGGVKNMVDVAKQTGVKHFVLLSSTGVSEEDNQFDRLDRYRKKFPEYVDMNLYDNVFIWKFKGEEYLRDSGLSYTVVRAGQLRPDFPRAQLGIYFSQGDRARGGQVGMADAASVLIECLNNRTAQAKTFEAFNFLSLWPNSWPRTFVDLKLD